MEKHFVAAEEEEEPVLRRVGVVQRRRVEGCLEHGQQFGLVEVVLLECARILEELRISILLVWPRAQEEPLPGVGVVEEER